MNGTVKVSISIFFFTPTWITTEMEELTNYLKNIIKKGGPEPTEYAELNKYFQSIGDMIRADKITRLQIRKLWQLFDESFLKNTMQGLTFNKPHGYAGDFEIIDKIYTKWVSPEKHLQNWDHFGHWQKATQAVRNRKDFFKTQLLELESSTAYKPYVLNVGSGPGRDIYEYINQTPQTEIHFECLDMDTKAIGFSQQLLKANKSITFTCRNVFRFKTKKQYNLVWSSGLFDYLDDKKFKFLLKSFFSMLAPTGELIVGNFSDTNPSKDYMEFGEWFLHHRSEHKLTELAKESGFSATSITIDKEPLGVNLFLRIKKTTSKHKTT